MSEEAFKDDDNEKQNDSISMFRDILREEGKDATSIVKYIVEDEIDDIKHFPDLDDPITQASANVSGIVTETNPDEKNIINKGLVDITKTLYETASIESQRINRLRNVTAKIESKLLEDLDVDNMSKADLVKAYKMYRFNLEASLGFMERMQKNSIQTAALLEMQKEIMRRREEELAQEERKIKDMKPLDRRHVIDLKQRLLKVIDTKK